MADTTKSSFINRDSLDIAGELLYVDRAKYNSGKLHNATPLFAKAVLGLNIVSVNVAELDDHSISIWYQHHQNAAEMPEIILRTICNIHTYHTELDRAHSLIINNHSPSRHKDPLFPED